MSLFVFSSIELLLYINPFFSQIFRLSVLYHFATFFFRIIHCTSFYLQYT